MSARTRFCVAEPEFEMGIAADGVDHDAIAVQDVLALTDHHIPGQRNRLLFEIVDAEVAARILILGGDSDAAPRLDAADILRPLRHRPLLGTRARRWICRRRAGDGGPGAALRPIEDDERLALHRHFALRDVHVAGERRHLVLVLHLKRGGVDLNRKILVLLVLQDALDRRARIWRRGIRRGRVLRQRNARRTQRDHQCKEPKPLHHRSFACAALTWSG